MLSHCQGAGLVNLGRGNVCSEQEVLVALEEGSLRGAALDVFPEEPLAQESLLWAHPRVVGQ